MTLTIFMHRFNLLLLLLLCRQPHAFSQTKTIEALKRNIEAAATGKEKLAATILLAEKRYTLHPDTLIKYAEDAKALAITLNDADSEVKAMELIATALTTKGLIDSSQQVIDSGLLVKVNDPRLLAELYNQKGRNYMRMNQYKEAIEMGYQTISIAEKSINIVQQIKGKTLIGWAYMEMGQYQEALAWHLKALRTTADTAVLLQYPIIFSNLAANYDNLGIEDSAFYYVTKAIDYSRQTENLVTEANALAIESELYIKAGKSNLAEDVLKEAVAIRKIIGDPFYIASDMSDLGYYYAHHGQPEKGIAVCLEGIAIAKQYKMDTKLLFLYSSLADNYKALGNTAAYAKVLENIIDLKDSVYQKNSAAELAELHTRYDLQKKENLIIQQTLDINRKNYLFYGSLLVLFFAALSSWLLFKEYKRKQEIRLLQMQEEEKILSAIAVTKAEENERKRIAADLHDNLGAYAAAIVSNIDQLSLQNSVPLQELKINSQSIVSQLNDTIWVLKKDNLSLTAISDRIKIFIQRIQPSYPRININVVERINTDLLMLPTHAFHLFQITQEAIINAVKHSGAKNVTIYIEGTQQWRITIADDGKGISAQKLKMATGNGLINMMHRSKEAGWAIAWTANEPSGTNVVISPTTN